MNFEFSPEQVQLRDQVRNFLRDRCPPALVRAVMEGDAARGAVLWQEMAGLGFLGASIPQEHGGYGPGYLELCVIAEEIGRAVAPVPVSSSLYLAAEFLLAGGDAAQQARWLPRLAAGEAVGTMALAEAAGIVTPDGIAASVEDGLLSGTKLAVLDGGIADFAIVAASANGKFALFLVELAQPGVQRVPVETIDPSRSHANLIFIHAKAAPLGEWALLGAVRDRAAVLMAFEQLGGAEKTLEMARDYALERIAFGRPIGSFQAIKHMLADMYVAVTLARANCFYGAWALSNHAAELPVAAATARVSATQAYQLCAKNMMQVHGGISFTWEADCHLHYRRSNLLALTLGSLSEWEDRLVDRLHEDYLAKAAA